MILVIAEQRDGKLNRASWETVAAAQALAGLPSAASAKTLRVKRELEGGWFQYVGMPLPALVTIQSGINQLRYATLKGIMAAKKKEIKKVAAAAPVTSRQRVLGLYAPQKAKQTVMIGGSAAEAAKELVMRLREEARVL